VHVINNNNNNNNNTNKAKCILQIGLLLKFLQYKTTQHNKTRPGQLFHTVSGCNPEQCSCFPHDQHVLLSQDRGTYAVLHNTGTETGGTKPAYETAKTKPLAHLLTLSKLRATDPPYSNITSNHNKPPVVKLFLHVSAPVGHLLASWTASQMYSAVNSLPADGL
jgi:hypothetical protein